MMLMRVMENGYQFGGTKMKIDLYTKSMLTIIAFSLVTIVFQSSTGTASAQSDSCGSRYHPCLVTNDLDDYKDPVPLLVKIVK